jgi:hypothetical protein
MEYLRVTSIVHSDGHVAEVELHTNRDGVWLKLARRSGRRSHDRVRVGGSVRRHPPKTPDKRRFRVGRRSLVTHI